MNTEAFENLVRVLEHVRDNKLQFNIEIWASAETLAEAHPAVGSCGTAACAIGWACRDSWFIERGLKLEQYGRLGRQVPVYYRRTAFEAVCAFFSITGEAADMLFYGPAYSTISWEDTTVEQVLFRVKEYMKERA